MDKKPKTESPFLERIMRDIEDVTPTPKWQFLAKKWLLYGAFTASVLLGALTITGMIFSFANVGFAYYRLTHETLFGFLLDAAPFLWIVSTILLIASAYATFRTTEGGYKYPIFYIAGGVALLSIFLGSLFFTFGVGEALENQTRKFSPFASPLERIEGKWNSPEYGRLAGVVLEIREGDFELEDVSGDLWNIESTHLRDGDLKILTINERFRILGIYKDNMFTACVILPWEILGKEEGERKEHHRFIPSKRAFKIVAERKDVGVRTNTCEDVRSHIELPLHTN